MTIQRSHSHLLMVVIGVGLVIFFSPGVSKAQWTTTGGGDATNNNSSGKVGIGTSSPDQRLTLNAPTGDLMMSWRINDVTKAYFGVASATDTVVTGSQLGDLAFRAINQKILFSVNNGTSAAMTLNTSGNVGIGTTNPATKLEVAGNLQVSNGGTLKTTGGADGYLILDGTAGGEVQFSKSGSAKWALGTDVGVAGDDLNLYSYTGSAVRMSVLNSNGYVGIGTTTPGYKLDVNGEINATGLRVNGTPISTGGSSQWNNGSGSIYYTGNVGVGTPNPARRLTISNAGAEGLEIGPGNALGGDPAGTISMFSYNRSGPGAYVGVNWYGKYWSFTGQTNDNYALNIGSNASSSHNFGFFMNAGSNSSDTAMRVMNSAQNVDFFYIRGDGNAGIGTTSPPRRFTVSNGGAEGLEIGPGNANGDGSGRVTFITYNRSGATYIPTEWSVGNFSISSVTSNVYALTVASNGATSQNYGLRINAGGNTSDAAMRVMNSGSSADYFFIRGDGNVGIGTTSPGYKLDVLGNTNVTGNLNITANGTGTGNIVAAGTINAKYQDVAEWVPSSEQLAAGTVVVLDATKSNQVTSSKQSYDTRVAGVVSEQPGIALGEKSDGKVLVATTGRVKVKVDATKAPIHIGDLLVTSDVPGLAMKSEPVEFAGRKMHMPGTLIGKALEPLEKGRGEILVLLSLQ
jgi:hypothetical protein